MKTRAMVKARRPKNVNFQALSPIDIIRLDQVREALKGQFYSTAKFQEEDRQRQLTYRQDLERQRLEPQAPTSVFSELCAGGRNFFGFSQN